MFLKGLICLLFWLELLLQDRKSKTLTYFQYPQKNTYFPGHNCSSSYKYRASTIGHSQVPTTSTYFSYQHGATVDSTLIVKLVVL